ncbi:Pentatricopeptide repeat-containing protein At4g01570 [Linum perenne]
MEKLRRASAAAASLRNPIHNLTPLKQMGDLLLVAFLTKTLSESGTRSLDPETLPLSENLVIQIIRRTQLDVSRKTDFFKWCSLRESYKHSAWTYSQMFRQLCRAEYLEDVPSLLRLMKGDGVLVGPETFKMLLDALIRLGKLDYAIQILDYMEELEASVSPLIYESVIVAFAKKNQVGLALNIFFKLLDEPGSKPGSAACNSLLAALKKADMREDFRTVFDRLRETKEFELDTWGYNICIHGFGMWGDLPTSLNLFREMQEKEKLYSDDKRFGPDLCTYNSLIQSLCLAGKVKDGLIVYEELKASGHRPDAFTYRILIQGCSKSSQINEATRVFTEMQYNGFVPEAVVYNSLLDGMFKANRVVEACQLFEKMVDDGVRATPWTYNILIHGLCRNGRAEAGYSLFSELKKKGQLVDGVTYSIVVLQLVKEGEFEEALRVVEEMEDKGIAVDLVTITALLIGFHRQGRWDWTERLMKHIRDGNLVPSVIKWETEMEASLKNRKNRLKEDYTPLFPFRGGIKEFLRASSAESKEPSSTNEDDLWSTSPHMDRLANQVKSGEYTSQLFSLARGHRVVESQDVEESDGASFDVAMVNTFMSIFLAKGQLSVACKLFEVFSNTGMNPASYTYNALMSSFVKKGYFDEAWNVLHEMGDKLRPADIATYNVIIQGLGKMGRADIASSVLDKLMDHGGCLDIVMYNTLINALGKAGRIDEANKLFDQMKCSGINPDVVTYNTLIEVHTRAGRLKEAHKLLKTMLDAGCLPDSVTDTILDALAREIDKARYQKASIISQNSDSPSS